MAQELVNTQAQRLELEQKLTHSLTAQQVMVMRMLEMPITQFEESVQTEMNENPALEASSDDSDDACTADNDDEKRVEGIDDGASGNDDGGSVDSEEEAFNAEQEREERKDELDSVLDSFDSDDRLEGSNYERNINRDPDADQEERIYGNMESFYDHLHDQMHEQDLTERQEMIMEYLIGSLDADGLLRKDLDAMSDEIAIHEYIDVSADEIERVLTILQSFDPAGIGAQSLQQCLLIQIFRKKATPMTKLMHTVINDYYGDFVHKRWKRIVQSMKMDELTAGEVFREIKRLNPRPGAALGETMGHSVQQVTPDFIIDTDEDDNISITLNKGKVPTLYVSRDFEGMIDAYKQNPGSMTRTDKEGLLYAQQKVNRARSYIEAVKQRQHTMIITMKTIAQLQKKYILSGDDSDLRPMILKDVADIAKIDFTTVSRVCMSKYAQMPWGMIKLKDFFSDRYSVGDGEEVSTREIKNALQDVVDAEDKAKPLSDIKLAAELKKRGYPIARRTVAKYREQLGIPVASLRKT